MLKATVAVRRAIAWFHRDTTTLVSRAQTQRRPGLGLARRAAFALHAVARPLAPAGSDAAGSSRDRLPAARPAFRPRRLLHLDSPERVVPILVAVFLLVASLTAAPGFVGAATGATTSAGGAPRLVIGGAGGPNDGLTGSTDTPTGPNDGLTGSDTPTGPNDGAGPVGDTGSTGGIGMDESSASVAARGDAPTSVAGQFLEDGTLLKPVVVDTTVADGSNQLRTYIVRSGDTLTGIASKVGVSMMTIWWANKLNSKDALHIGQKLVIPPVNGLVVTVGATDTLASVAAAHHVDPQEIVATNQLTDPTLVIGQVLILPGARGAAIPTPKPTPTTNVASISSVASSGSGTPTVRPVTDYSGGKFAWPVPGGYISQYFHYGHPALDIAAAWGSPIDAAADGVVTFAGWRNNGGGYQIWISHGSGLYTTYNHLSSISTSAGASVSRGEVIGRVGATGDATGPHCHFEIWIGPIWDGGVRVNPLGYF